MERRTAMKEQLMQARRLIRADWKCYRYGILAAAGMMITLQLLFGAICPVRILFGLPCPGCGLTRAVTLLLHGDLAGSVAMHPMAIPALLLIFYFPFVRYFFAKGFTFWRICVMIWLVFTLIVFGYRMLTQFPGSEPICFYDGLLQQWITAQSGA